MANGDMMQLNRLAAEIVRQAEANAGRLRVGVHQLENGAKLIDFGIDCEGGLQAGLELARICTSGLAEAMAEDAQMDDAAGAPAAPRTSRMLRASLFTLAALPRPRDSNPHPVWQGLPGTR